MQRATRVSKVTIAATSFNLVSLADLKTLLGIADSSQDTYLALILTQASVAAASYVNRDFVPETIEERIWPQRNGLGLSPRLNAPPLLTLRWPILNVVSITEAIGGIPTPLVKDIDFVVAAAEGMITRLDAAGYPIAWGLNALVVTYAAGYSPIPADLQMAVVSWIKAVRFSQLRDPMIREEKADGIFSTSYWFGSGPNNDAGIPPDVAVVLNGYGERLVG